MTEAALHITWLAAAPLCLLTDILGILVLCHYRTRLHGSDVTFLSLIVSMATNAGLIVPVPAILGLISETWTLTLCRFYVWAFVTLRIVQLTNLVILSAQWICILKFSSLGKHTSTTFSIKMAVPITWVCAGVAGIHPVTGKFSTNVSDSGQCHTLPFDISNDFAIFIIILSLTCVLLTISFASDAHHILRQVGKIARTKYGIGRFYVPKTGSEVAEGYTIHERLSQLNFACDMCHLILIFTLISSCLNHIPHTIITFLQLSGDRNRKSFEQTTLSLLLLEALVTPHVLWMSSRRYRHALVYLWRTKILRKSGEDEDDPSSCVLQSYTRKLKRNSIVTHLNESNQTLHQSPKMADEELVYDDVSGAAVMTDNINTNNRKHNTRRKEPITTVDLLNVGSIAHIDQKSHDQSRGVRRSLSGSSRSEWKEQMRKKHLPAIFVNEAFDSSDYKIQSTEITQQNSPDYGDMDNSSLHSMYYYMSSDYHPDYLNTDSLTRHVHLQNLGMMKSSSDSWPRKGKKDNYNTQQQCNSLPQKQATRMTGNEHVGHNSSLPRKKVPKMGTKCPESGSNSSLYSRGHSRSTSENSLHVYRHYRSASDFVPYGLAQWRGGEIPQSRSISLDEKRDVCLHNLVCSQSLKDLHSKNKMDDLNVRLSNPSDRKALYIHRTDSHRKRGGNPFIPPRQESDRSESEGISGTYNDSDIEVILDGRFIRETETFDTTLSVSNSLDVSDIEFEINSLPRETTKKSNIYPEETTSFVSDTKSEHGDDPLHNVNNCRRDDHLDSNDASNLLDESGIGVSLTQIQNNQYKRDFTDNFDVTFDVTLSDRSNTIPQKRTQFVDKTNFTKHTAAKVESRSNQGSAEIDPYHGNRNCSIISISPRFEDDIDKGFEDALNASYNSRESLCSANGVNSDSLSGSIANDSDPFGHSDQASSEDFKTDAIVYNLLHSSPDNTEAEGLNHAENYFPASDSGFTASFESKNTPSTSPWPDCQEPIKASDFGFDSHFETEVRNEVPIKMSYKGSEYQPDVKMANHDLEFPASSTPVSYLKEDIEPVYF